MEVKLRAPDDGSGHDAQAQLLQDQQNNVAQNAGQAFDGS